MFLITCPSPDKVAVNGEHKISRVGFTRPVRISMFLAICSNVNAVGIVGYKGKDDGKDRARTLSI